MFETIGVLVVFMIIVGIGLQFYGRVQDQSFADLKSKFEQLDSVKMSLIVSHMPEFICSSRNVVEGTCFDLEKISYFSSNEDLKSFYIELLGENVVWVDVVYPPADAERYVIYNGTLNQDYTYSRAPHAISIYDSKNRRYLMGVLYVEQHFPVVG